MEGFEVSILELTKVVVTMRKDGGTVGNKYDKLSNEVNEAKKRLAEVEHKK